MPLNEQELLNAIYSGPFVTAAKAVFSNSQNAMIAKWSAYISGRVNRQDFLATALDWVSRGHAAEYLSAHRFDPEIRELQAYFNTVIDWVSGVFLSTHSEMTAVNWGAMYERFRQTPYDPDAVEKQVAALYADEAVTQKRGIFEYVLGGCREPKLLNIRLFEKSVIRTVYERQKQAALAKGVSNCPLCAAEKGSANHTRIYKPTEMDADHVTAWSKGGRSDAANCQMLCKFHNRSKGNW